MSGNKTFYVTINAIRKHAESGATGNPSSCVSQENHAAELEEFSSSHLFPPHSYILLTLYTFIF